MLYHGEVVYRDGAIVGDIRAGSYGHTLGGAIGLSMIEPPPPGGVPINKAYIESGTWEVKLTHTKHIHTCAHTHTRAHILTHTGADRRMDRQTHRLKCTLRCVYLLPLLPYSTVPLALTVSLYLRLSDTKPAAQVDIAGTRYPAVASLAPMYDPKNTRIKA